jgi:hypothetical protein
MSQNGHPEIISSPDEDVTQEQINNGSTDCPIFSLIPISLNFILPKPVAIPRMAKATTIPMLGCFLMPDQTRIAEITTIDPAKNQGVNTMIISASKGDISVLF